MGLNNIFKNVFGRRKVRSLDEIMDTYQEKSVLPAKGLVSESKAQAGGTLTEDKIRKAFQDYLATGTFKQHPDNMDEESYKREREALIKSSRLYAPPKDDKVSSNDWDGE